MNEAKTYAYLELVTVLLSALTSLFSRVTISICSLFRFLTTTLLTLSYLLTYLTCS